MAPAPGQYPVAPKKKVSPIVWILAGIAGFVILAGIALLVGGFFIAKKFAENPTLAAATAIAAANPDVEIVSNNPSTGTITFREKSSGKTVTLNLDQIKQGRITFSDSGKDVTFQGGEGGLTMKSSDGSSMEIGTGKGKLPDWVPAYPGAKPEVGLSATGEGKETVSASFTTSDDAAKVSRFFADGFKSAGLTASEINSGDGGMVTASSDKDERGGMVMISREGASTKVTVNAWTKK
jgi:hypothetical protein